MTRAFSSRAFAGAVLVLTFALVCACLHAHSAFAATSSSAATSFDELDIGLLSDRYNSLNNLGNSLNEEESVVIDTRVAVLISANLPLDGNEVRFTGEAVGDVVSAEDGYKWVNVMGTVNNVIGVRMTDEQAEAILNVGSYHQTGTRLQITGSYQVACPLHQGELDVHAEKIEVLDNGGPRTHLVSNTKMTLGFGLCVLAVVILGSFMLIRRHVGKREDS